MRILVIYADRSTDTPLQHLKSPEDDVLIAGQLGNSNQTLELLIMWAEEVILQNQETWTELVADIGDETGRDVDQSKFKLWDGRTT